jgi:hypothetical protein
MKWRATSLILIGLAVCCATVWWAIRSPDLDSSTSKPVSADAPPATAVAVSSAPAPLEPASPVAPPPRTDQISAAEREQMAAMFAAEPALIDALEDATGSSDPVVREDAENFLNSLDLPAPNPAPVAE